MRRAAMTAAILACVLGLTACNDDDKGSSSPASGANTPGAASGKTGTPLAGTDPCTLLKPADVPDLTQDDYIKPKTINSAGTPTCAGYDFSVAIKDVDQGVHDMEFNGVEVKALPDIAGHRAAMDENTVGTAKDCAIILEVTADELVRVTVSNSQAPTKNCATAQKAAVVVAGRLPG